MQFINGKVEQCQAGFIFDQQDGCVPGDSDSCRREVATPLEPDQVDFELSLNEICAGNELGFVPDPNSCTHFIVCVFQQGNLTACPNRIPIFDSVRLLCVAGKKAKDVHLKRTSN